MQLGEAPRNHHGTLARFVPDARCILCSAARSSVVDLMHVADCKGVTALVLGSIVSLLLAGDRLGTSKDVRLQLINTMLAEQYDQLLSAQPWVPIGSNAKINYEYLCKVLH